MKCIQPKKGQLGIVDKSFMTNDEEGKRIAKVRIRDILSLSSLVYFKFKPICFFFVI